MQKEAVERWGGSARDGGWGRGRPLPTRKKDQSSAVFIITITDVYDSLRAEEGGVCVCVPVCVASPFLPTNPFNAAAFFFFTKAGAREDVNQCLDETRGAMFVGWSQLQT